MPSDRHWYMSVARGYVDAADDQSGYRDDNCSIVRLYSPHG